MIEGTLGGADKITGEKTFNAAFTDGPTTVPVTITYRYRISSTPPAMAAPKR